MKKAYAPPFTITPTVLALASEISEIVGKLSVIEAQITAPKLRKENFIKTITGTLEIEGNTLGAEKVTAIIEGKRVLGSVREIAEVKGAVAVYENLGKLDYKKESALLSAHKILMDEILKDAGKYRKIQVGVGGKSGVTHIAPPADRVPQLMGELFSWLESTTEHPLIVSSIFHYEFEFIHPFADGNGRIGRLWQTLILSKWKEFFAFVPIESVVWERQKEYYEALENSGADGESTLFVEFMLGAILEACKNIEKSNQKSNQKIISLIAQNPKITIAELVGISGLSESGVKKVIAKLKNEGKLKRVGSLKGGEWEVLNANKQ